MKIGVVADDLTGANATGVLLSKQGFRTAAVVFNGEIPFDGDLDGVCVDTDSRYIKEEIAVKRVQNAVREFMKHNTKIICKRIDSTVRGNIGVEIDAMLEEIGKNSVAILVPSFPASGRVLSGGYLLVEGIPVQETDVAKDPIKPITESYVPSLVQKQSIHKVGHISLTSVLAGSDVLTLSITKEIESGNKIIVIDAVTDDDVDVIAKAMSETTLVDFIPVDPGPLTAAYSKAQIDQSSNQGKIIVTVGSVTSLTGKQLSYLKLKTNSTPVYVSAEKLATMHSNWEEEITRVVAVALERIKQDDVLIITTHVDNQNIIDLKQLAQNEQTTQDALAKRITDGLAKITRLVIEQTDCQIDGCFTSGGDVTASLCAVSMANGIKLIDEVLPLVAYGSLIGGILGGLPIVTKGGMVGDKTSIYTSVKYLQTRNRKRSVQK